MDKDLGDRVLSAMEAVRFGFEHKTNGFPIDSKDPNVKSYVKLLVYDIGLVLKGDVNEPRYGVAQTRLRGTKVNLYQYARFLCKKFGVAPFSMPPPSVRQAYRVPDNLRTFVDMWSE